MAVRNKQVKYGQREELFEWNGHF